MTAGCQLVAFLEAEVLWGYLGGTTQSSQHSCSPVQNYSVSSVHSYIKHPFIYLVTVCLSTRMKIPQQQGCACPVYFHCLK